MGICTELLVSVLTFANLACERGDQSDDKTRTPHPLLADAVILAHRALTVRQHSADFLEVPS